MNSDYANFAEVPPVADTAEPLLPATAIAEAITRARILYAKRLESFSNADRQWLSELKVSL
jgi:hypothetical protein